jgi:zinc/manganese transport system substrate-binding protein
MKKPLGIGALVAIVIGALVALFVSFGQGGQQSSDPNPSPTLTRDGETGVVKVVTSTQVWADITKLIGGDWVEVTVLVPEGQDPHSYEASARDQLAVTEAELVIANGGGYDEFLDQLVASREGEFVFLKLVEGEHHHGEDAHTAEEEHAHDHSEEANEHIWFDFALTQQAAEHIAEAIAELRPEAFQATTAGYDFFSSELSNLEIRLEALREKALGLGFIAPEGVANLMLLNAGMENLTPEELADAIEEEREVPLAALNQAKSLLENKVAKLLVVNLNTTDSVSKALVEAANAGGRKIVYVSETGFIDSGDGNPKNLDYLDWMSLVLDQLQEAIY